MHKTSSAGSSSTSSHPTPLPFAADDVFSAPLPAALDLTRPLDIETTELHSPASPSPRDPVSSLARANTPFFLDLPPSPIRKHLPSQSPVTHFHEDISGTTAWSSPLGRSGLGLGGGVWTLPGGVQGSMGATMKMDLVTAAEWRDALEGLSRSDLDVDARMNQVISIISSFHTRVSSLERDMAIQEVELRQLRSLVRRSGQATPDPGFTPPRPTTPTAYSFPYYPQTSPTQLQAQARPFDPTLVQTPPASNYASPSPYPSLPSIPHSHSYPGYSPVESLSYSPLSAFSSARPDLEFDLPSSVVMNRRRSRAPSEILSRRRDRGASMSAFEAQTPWMKQQSAVPRFHSTSPQVNLEPINYRALLEHDADIDEDAFVSRVVVFNDQQCSLFLQQRVRSTTSESRRMAIFQAVGRQLHSLCVSKFGNFLVSRCLENGGPELAAAYTQALVGHFLTLSLDPFGCHVTQKLLDCGDQLTKDHVIKELISHSSTLTQKNACHVWNRLLSSPNPAPFYEQLAATGKGLWAEVAKDEGGSLLIQRMCEDWAEAHTSTIAQEIFAELSQVATSPCGSFVLAHMMERNALPFRSRILELGITLCRDGYGVKVVEKALRGGREAPADLTAFIEDLVKPAAEPGRLPAFVDVASHLIGAQLLSSLITGQTSAEDKLKLIKAVTKYSDTKDQLHTPSSVRQPSRARGGRPAPTLQNPPSAPPGLWANGAASAPPNGQPFNQQQQQGGANTSLLTIVRAQIVFLLSTLSEDNFTKNRDEIRSLIDLHGPAPQQHLIRRLILAAGSLLAPNATSPPPAPTPSQPSPQPALVLRLLASEVQRMARDPGLAGRFREAVLEGAEGSGGSDSVLRSFSLSTLLAHPSLAELSPLERLVFTTPFLTLLYTSTPSTPAATGAKRALGLDAAAILRQVLPKALDQLGAPAASQADLAELSPLPISRLFSILLSDFTMGEKEGEGEQVFSDEERRAIVLAAVRGRLGPEVGSQALTHALGDMSLNLSTSPSPIAILSRLSPAPALCSPDLVRAVLSRFGNLGQSESDSGGGGAEMRVAAMLFELVDQAMKDAEVGSGIDLASWVRGVHELQPALRWADVTRAFDNPSRALPETWGLRLFAAFLNLSPSPADPSSPSSPSQYTLTSATGGSSAISGLWSPWANPHQQFGLLERLLYLPVESFSLPSLPSVHKVVSLDDAANSSPTIKNLASSVQQSAWNCRELIATLIRLSEAAGSADVASRVHELLDRGCKSNPELVLVALVQIEKPWNALHAELTARLLSTFLTGHPSHQLVFLRIYQIDRLFLTAALRDFYAESEMNLSRILDVAQDLKILDVVLDLRPFSLSLDLAALASRREYLNLEKWLSNSIAAHGSAFVRATLEFVGHKVRHDLHRQELDPAPEPTTLSLSANTVAIFMRALRLNHELFTGNDVELFKEVRTQCLQLYPRLMNFAPGNADNEPGMAVVTFSSEIESECDALYKRMYDQEISVDNVVSALQRAKEADNQHDHEFFACFLHGLFDEHRFFNTYPANELSLTASLFGDLIQYQLIDFIPLGIAVRYVLDALRNPPDSSWFRFGIQALARFQSRLVEWPQLAHSILSIPHVQQSNPEVANAARTALQQRENGAGGENGGGLEIPDGGADFGSHELQLHQEEPERPVFTAISVDRSGESEPEAPDEDTSDKILFIVNNLAPNNFDAKVTEMADRIDPIHFAWFAHYLVAQRVSIEPNNHGLYQKFLDALSMPLLVKRVLYETFVKLATLLNSEKTVQSSTERTLLKNLGSWLGGLTLAKNKPIKQQNIAFKDLLIQGYDSNRLIVAIPFVCKVLEQCSKSRVFKPPNPWLMAIIRLLVELYQFAELKLNLKFEIEVLCKSLNVDLKDVEPTDILRNRPKEAPAIEMPAASLMPQEQDEQSLSRGFAPPGVHSLPGVGEQGRPHAPALMLGSNQAGYSLSLQDTISAALQTLPNQISFSPQLPLFATNNALKRLVFVAIDRAVREIIAPVVERSVTIAGISTRELTMKDFAMEGDEEKMGTAAHLMVQNLAGSLALVTCKEPLRISMVTHIRNLLLQNGFTEQNIPEQAILLVAADNLELACGVVEKVAMEKAVLEVDDGLAPAYLARRTHRERSREAFWDTAAMAASHYSGMLPDPLRLKLGGLQSQQLQVYEDFSRVRTLQIQAEQRNGASYTDSPALAAQTPQVADAIAPTPLTGPQAMEKFTSLVAELEKFIATESSSALARLGPESEIRQILQQIPLVAASAATRDETALGCSQKIVQLLYRSETALAREVYVFLLERLCSISAKVAKEVTAWLVYAEDERKFNVPVTTALVQARLINIVELDVQLAKFVVREYRPSVVDFAARFLAECLLEASPVATREQLTNTLEALAQAARVGKGTETSKQVLQDVRSAEPIRPASPAAKSDDADVRQQLTYCFAEWVRLYQQSFSVEKSFVDFVVQLQNQGILKGEEISSLFFRVCAEVSVDSYIKHKAAGGSPATGIFQPVDAFAKLIVFMIKYHADPTGANNDKAKVHYMTKVLSIVVLVLANSHEELGPHFQQKPFFRFFSSLLSNLHAIESHLGSAYYQILVALSHSLNTLQPLFFPGFTFSWVGLISHRLFMPKLLMMKDKEGWSSFHRQLISLLRFLAPFLRRGELGDTTRALYLGTQRIILVLLHDFPDFLSQAFFALCDVIPPQCIQLHNLILSAFPVTSSQRLPDPLQPGLKIELLPECQKSPQVLTDYTAALTTSELRASLDKYLQTKAPASFPATVRERLVALPRSEALPSEPKYNIPLINSLVMYLGVVAINQSKASTGAVKFDPKSASAQFLSELFNEMDAEARYYLVAAAANQLRYPNAHTYWFSEMVLVTFIDSPDEQLREIIVRVILERVLAQRPHPFGILVTFQTLLDERYNLLKHKFVQSTPDIAQLFTQVASRAVVASS